MSENPRIGHILEQHPPQDDSLLLDEISSTNEVGVRVSVFAIQSGAEHRLARSLPVDVLSVMAARSQQEVKRVIRSV